MVRDVLITNHHLKMRSIVDFLWGGGFSILGGCKIYVLDSVNDYRYHRLCN